MRVCVFVPTHIKDESQCDSLVKCLESLVNQTTKPDICLSASFSDESHKAEFSKKILLGFSKDVKFTLNKHQMDPMDHLMKFTEIHAKEYEMIMFCNDNESYVEHRVEEFISAYEDGMIATKDQDVILGGVRELIESDKSEIPGYWFYGLTPGVLEGFFEKYSKKQKDKNGIMYLGCYLRLINNGSLDQNKIGFMKIVIKDQKDQMYICNEIS